MKRIVCSELHGLAHLHHAFVSRICKSVANSAILGFLSTELEEEDNCAIVFQTILEHLSSSDLATARVFDNWMQFFKLKCSTRDDFLEFFSSAKGILHKLKTANSVAVTDDTFICAYSAKTIKAPELQQEVKQFILSNEGDYASILDKVFKDYRAMESREHMCSTNTKQVTFARRGAGAEEQPRPPSLLCLRKVTLTALPSLHFQLILKTRCLIIFTLKLQNGPPCCKEK